MTKEQNPGCLSSFFGLIILFYIIYVPVYFFVMNNELDTAKEASLETVLLGPLVVGSKYAPEGKIALDEAESLIESNFDYIKSVEHVDLYESLEEVLEDNGNVSNLKFSKYKADKDAVFVVTSFNLKDLGNVRIISVSTEKKFIKVQSAKFLGIAEIKVNDRPVNNSSLFVAKYIYGLKNDGFKRFEEIAENLF